MNRSREIRRDCRIEGSGALSFGEFVLRVVVALAILSLAFLAWHIRHALVTAYVSVVVAVILVAGAEVIRKLVPISHRWAVFAFGLSMLIAFVLFGYMLWPQLSIQYGDLLDQLSDAIDNLEQSTGLSIDGSLGLDNANGPLAGLWVNILPMAGTLLSVMTSLVLVVVAGTFLAISPKLYRDGLVKLFPSRHHHKLRDTLDRTGEGLKFWLVGKIVSMTIVGVLTIAGTWLIGLPSPLALGAVAFLTEFVPLVGPLFGAIPALLLAMAESGRVLLWTILAYLVIQQVESNILTPVIQRKAVNVPPALFMLSVLSMGALFGMIGIILAGPLTVTFFVLVQALYMEDALHDTGRGNL